MVVASNTKTDIDKGLPPVSRMGLLCPLTSDMWSGTIICMYRKPLLTYSGIECQFSLDWWRRIPPRDWNSRYDEGKLAIKDSEIYPWPKLRK